jgi:hypothetical protein
MAMVTENVTSLIRQRISVRSYQPAALERDACESVSDAIAALPAGPFGIPARFMLVSASAQDRGALRGLSTYGFIKNAPSFLIGAAHEGRKTLEDFGYQMEYLVLAATRLGLGTCWLGGTFTRSGFASKIGASAGEIIPAVCALGYPAENPTRLEEAMRRNVGARDRIPFEQLFFADSFGRFLTPETAGAFAEALEMVRLAPSASNKQPWRILKQGNAWLFYLQRTKGYREGMLTRLLGVADMQRVDMGIAMCHFELTARQLGLPGCWKLMDPGLTQPEDNQVEYVATWINQ